MLLRSFVYLGFIQYCLGNFMTLGTMDYLDALFSSGNGVSWNWNKGDINEVGIPWNFSRNSTDGYMNNPCSNWQGICCASEIFTKSTKCKPVFGYVNMSKIPSDDSVIALFLVSFGLDGTIAPQLFNISTIQYLDISNNSMLEGQIPATINRLMKIAYLNLAWNSFSGNVPTVFSSSLQVFSLNNNMLDGCIADLSELSSVEILDFSSNLLVGNIPSLGNLTALQQLLLSSNSLNGTIPLLGKLRSIQQIYLDHNELTGTIPSLEYLQHLTDLHCESNNFTGTIPILDTLSSLNYLYLDYNGFVGTLPTLSGLSKLKVLYVNRNSLVGTIPLLPISLDTAYLDHNYFGGTLPSLSALTHLENFDIDSNSIGGTIPTLSALKSLRTLYLNTNYLIGTLPEVTGLSLLKVLDVHNNILSGFIPELTGMTALGQLWLNDNNFSGPVPSLAGLVNLLSITLNNNELSKSLSTALKSLPQSLQYLSINNNHFTGTISTAITRLGNLTYLNIQDNLFTGTIPPMLSMLTLLQFLLIHNNLLSGSVKNCFPSSLVNIDISENSFTGAIPQSIFGFQSISNISIVKNCFTGSLVEDICNASNTLQSLYMDGLTSGYNCEHSIFFGRTYSVNRFMVGSIPSCVYQMSVLQVLGLSGNGLTGTLSSGAVLSPSLQILSLSHNQITGPIPSNFQDHPFDSLDMSYNKLSGTLTGLVNFYSNSTSSTSKALALQVNRLSGLIPSQYRQVNNISVVTGNLFDCTRESDLPFFDPGTAHVQCGSFDLNVGLGIFACVLFACGVAIIWHWLTVKSLFDDVCIGSEANMVRFGTAIWCALCFNRQMLDNILVTTIFAVLVYLPIQLILKFGFERSLSTHLNQYAYSPSLAFLTGSAVAACVLVVTLTISTVLWARGFGNEIKTTVDSNRIRHRLSGLHEIGYWTFGVICDGIIIITANACYVLIAVSYNPLITNCSLVALALFKLGWNSVVIPMMLRKLESRIPLDVISPSTMVAWLYLFNNVAVPIFVTMCIQPLCFYYCFVPSSDISISIAYEAIDTSTDASTSKETAYLSQMESISYQPPFSYSYQCSSVLITSYVPMYVVMYLVSGFIVPLCSFSATYINDQQIETPWLYRKIVWILESDIMKSKQYLVRQCDEVASVDFVMWPVLVNGATVPANLICNWAIILTFGLAYPLLSILVCVSGCVEIMQWRMLVGRYLSFCSDEAIAADVRATLLARLEASCFTAGSGDILHQSRWLLLASMSLFFSIFLLDMAGDRARSDWREMLWAPLVVLLWPIFLKLCEVMALSTAFNLSGGNSRANSNVSDEGMRMIGMLRNSLIPKKASAPADQFSLQSRLIEAPTPCHS